MKLDWKRAGCASIAESGGWTLTVYKYGESGVYEKPWCIRVLSNGGSRQLDIQSYEQTRDDAEAACEKWLEDKDRPVWRDVTEWLSYAEWRGWRMTAADSIGSFVGRVHTPTKGFATYPYRTIVEAKSAAEKHVRENT